MKLELFRTLWGHDGTVAAAVEAAREDGFDGIEGPVSVSGEDGFFAALGGMPWIAEVCTCTPPGRYVPEPGRTPEDHLESLRRGLDRAVPGGPRFVTAMAGWDGWELPAVIRFHEGVLALQESSGVPIRVETHRARCTYSPWVTLALLRELPELRLTVDFSHWCVVCERLVPDESPELLEAVAACCGHLHARVGYDQGPQVPDPRVARFEAERAAHERWWRRVWDAMAERGIGTVTMTPEAGFDGYQQGDPSSGRLAADPTEVNRWMAARLNQVFAAWVASRGPRRGR